LATKPIYLDYNATTPVDEAVLNAMLPYFNEKFGNASSANHSFGWAAQAAVENAREQLAALIDAEPQEIIFTSGATESINMALKGVAHVYREKGNHIITATTEHKAVLDCCKSLEKQQLNITYLPVDSNGIIDLQELEKSITSKTILICVMLANNETGVIQPIEAIAEIAKRHQIILMSDATQAIGKISVNVNTLGIDIMPVSAHKFYGPKGTGALFIRRKKPRVVLQALIEGGGHEKNLRSGTLNVPGIVGLGKAASLANSIDAEKTAILRNELESSLLQINGASVNGHKLHRLPNTANICFKHVKSEYLIKQFADKLAVATGSACSSALPEPSHVLLAMGLSTDDAYASIRFSLGKYTNAEEIQQSIAIIKNAFEKLK
jgi:cysteine desulfurase